MEKRISTETVNGEIQVPEAIIQHIQSFLNGKEVAQTSILSKSWYSAWSTHPNLDFDQRHFSNSSQYLPERTERFSEFSRKTMLRYENMSRKIDSLRLSMDGSHMGNQGLNRSLAGELIVRALKMGARDLHLQISRRQVPFVIPHEVLGSETLTCLSVSNCEIHRGLDGKINCSRLKSLSLVKVLIEGDTIWDIVRSCPLIEKLILSQCECLSKVGLDDHGEMNNMSALDFPVEFGKQNVGSILKSRIHLYEFHKLKHLFLEMVEISSSFFSNFSSKFPSLENLSVHHCIWNRHIQIRSSSLECLSFAEKSDLWAQFDVPRIRRFSFSGSCLPALCFEKTSSEWKCDISILDGAPGTLSLVRLKKLLKKLSQSRISLSICIGLISEKNFEYVGNVEGLRRPLVENLTLLMMDAPSSICSALLGCLFWSCRPKFITQYWLPESCVVFKGNGRNDIVEILFKRLIQVTEDSYLPNRSMFGQCDLEEVNVEYFEETLAEWRPLPWKTLLDASEDPENIQNFRFQLRWVQ